MPLNSQPVPKHAESSLRQHLRTATQQSHAALDLAVSACLKPAAKGLDRLLQLHAAVLPGIVAGLDRAGAAQLWPRWNEAERVRVLLEECGQRDLPCGTSPEHEFDSKAACWGGMWAVVGSRLGNRVLARRLGSDSAFLHSAEGQWPDFLQHLEQAGAGMGATCRAAATNAAATVLQRYAGSVQRTGRA